MNAKTYFLYLQKMVWPLAHLSPLPLSAVSSVNISEAPLKLRLYTQIEIKKKRSVQHSLHLSDLTCAEEDVSSLSRRKTPLYFHLLPLSSFMPCLLFIFVCLLLIRSVFVSSLVTLPSLSPLSLRHNIKRSLVYVVMKLSPWKHNYYIWLC